MAAYRPFGPTWGANQVVTLAAATPQTKNVNADSYSLRVMNSGAGDLYVRAFSSQAAASTASAADFPVLAGTSAVINIGNMDRVSLFSSAGTTAQIMAGDGGV